LFTDFFKKIIIYSSIKNVKASNYQKYALCTLRINEFKIRNDIINKCKRKKGIFD